MAVSSQQKNMMIWSEIFCNTTTLKNEMEAKEDGNIKQESIGSGKGDC